jgi:hypothetical protein
MDDKDTNRERRTGFGKRREKVSSEFSGKFFPSSF